MLYATSTIFLFSFFWILFMALSVVHRLRQIRLERLESSIPPQRSVKSETTKHFLAYVYSPLDEMQSWHGKGLDKSERHATGPIVLPLRYPQTLLFADDLGETHPNPTLSRAS
jgi:hypothetical protein